MGNNRDVTLTLTEFADPDGKCTYFRIPDMSEAVPDELAGILTEKILSKQINLGNLELMNIINIQSCGVLPQRGTGIRPLKINIYV